MSKRPPSRSSPDHDPLDKVGFFDAYASFARTLRLWFIAYGIGGPAAFLNNEAAARRLNATGHGPIIAYAFLGGVAVQVVLAVLYKTAMWYLYMAEEEPHIKASRLYRASKSLSEAYWIEALGDLVTLALFAGATLRLVRVFFASP